MWYNDVMSEKDELRKKVSRELNKLTKKDLVKRLEDVADHCIDLYEFYNEKYGEPTIDENGVMSGAIGWESETREITEIMLRIRGLKE